MTFSDINLKGLQNLLKIPLLRERAAVAAIMIAVGIIFFIFLYRPVKAEYASAQSSVLILEKEAENNRLLIAETVNYVHGLEEARKRYDMLEARLESSAGVMPAESELSDIIREVTSSQPGISFLSITPGSAVPQGGYLVQPLSLKIGGGFTSLGGYISRVEGSKRSLEIDNISITKSEQDGVVANIKLGILLFPGS